MCLQKSERRLDCGRHRMNQCRNLIENEDSNATKNGSSRTVNGDDQDRGWGYGCVLRGNRVLDALNTVSRENV